MSYISIFSASYSLSPQHLYGEDRHLFLLRHIQEQPRHSGFILIEAIYQESRRIKNTFRTAILLAWCFSHSTMADSFDPMDCSLPVFSVHGISQARILEWGAISTSKTSSHTKDQTRTSCNAGSLLHFRWILYWQSHQGSPCHQGNHYSHSIIIKPC